MPFGAPMLLAATVALKVLVPSFDTEKLPAFAGERVSELVAKAVVDAGCSSAIAMPDLPADKREAISACYGQVWCLAGVAATMSADHVVLGTLRHAGDRYELEMLVVDVAKRRVVQSVTQKSPDRLDFLPLLAEQSAQPLCDALSGGDLAITALPEPPKTGDAFARLPPTAPPLPPNELALTLPEPAPFVPPPSARPSTPGHEEPRPSAQGDRGSTMAPKGEVVVAQAPARPVRKVLPAVVSKPVAAARTGWLEPPVTPRARLWSCASLGAGGVALAIASGFGAGVLSSLADRSAARSQDAFYAAHATMLSRATVANSAFGVAGVALAGSALLWIKGDALFGDVPAPATNPHR